MTRVTNAAEVWRRGGEDGDAHASASALAEDVVLVSPLTDRFTFRGRDEVEDLLTSVFEVFTDIVYDVPIRAGDAFVLSGVGSVRGVRLEELQRHELNADGEIRRVTIVMRPLPAVTALLRELGPRVARAQGRPAVAVVLRLAGAFLDTVATSGDRHFIPLARPSRTVASPSTSD